MSKVVCAAPEWILGMFWDARATGDDCGGISAGLSAPKPVWAGLSLRPPGISGEICGAAVCIITNQRLHFNAIAAVFRVPLPNHTLTAAARR